MLVWLNVNFMYDIYDKHLLKLSIVNQVFLLLQVISRIFYCVNRTWSGRITLPELRKSNFLQVGFHPTIKIIF